MAHLASRTVGMMKITEPSEKSTGPEMSRMIVTAFSEVRPSNLLADSGRGKRGGILIFLSPEKFDHVSPSRGGRGRFNHGETPQLP